MLVKGAQPRDGNAGPVYGPNALQWLAGLRSEVNVLHGLDALQQLPPGGAMTVGNFDGVHRGHRKIIDVLKASNPSAVVVVTFEPHPMSVLRPNLAPPRLSPPLQKHRLLEAAGVTHLIELPPTPEVLGLSPEAFWARLRDEARPVMLAEGHDFHFGKGAKGNIDLLREWAKGTGVNVVCVEPAEVTLPGLHVAHASSSLARWLIAHGRVLDAAAVLGRPYELSGEVVKGFQRGREIGFPTANVRVVDQLIPADGVYAATALVGGAEHAAALSIGTNPTFDGPARTVEAYLLDFDGDLYGQTLTLRLDRWLRGQVKYPGVDALVEQLHRDVSETRRLSA